MKCKDCSFDLDQCIKLLRLFTTSELCSKLIDLYCDDDTNVDIDYTYCLQEKEEALEELRCQTNKLHDMIGDIFDASSNGNLKLLKYLIEELNTDIEQTDKFGNTPILLAASHNQLSACKYLISQNANIKATNRLGRTALHMACATGSTKVAKYFIETCKMNLNQTDNEGNTPLHRAATFGQSESVKLLIQFNADKALKNKRGHTPLDVACKSGHPEFLPIIKQLLQ